MSAEASEQLAHFAEILADQAGTILRRYFRRTLEIERKSDLSPVTLADRECEAALRAAIRRTFPNHGILGEEAGGERLDAEYVWVIDPLDGTRGFTIGKPLYGTLIAGLQDNVPIVGLIDMPSLAERWVGVTGRPTLMNGRAVRCRPCARLDQAQLNATAPGMFADPAIRARFDRLYGAVAGRHWGGDCYGYGLVASGWLDLVAEAAMAPHDWCALAPVIEGAGGVITDWQGDRLGIQGDGTVLASGDPRLHAAALAVLNSPDS